MTGPRHRRSVCKSCGASIFFATTDKSARTPIDFEPCDDGNLSVSRGIPLPKAVVLRPAQAAGMREAGMPTYRSHFASCPDADRFRHRARARATSRRNR